MSKVATIKVSKGFLALILKDIKATLKCILIKNLKQMVIITLPKGSANCGPRAPFEQEIYILKTSKIKFFVIKT